MPRGTMLCPEMEHHGSGSTVFDSHQLGARWAGDQACWARDQPQLRCGYLWHLRIERRPLYHVQSVRNLVRQWQQWQKFEKYHWDASKLFQQVGASTREKPVRLVGKGKRWWQVKFLWRTKLDFDISLLPGASLFLEALHFQGRIEVETSTDQSKMSYLAFENCTVEPPAPDAKQLALAKLDQNGFQDPSASAWQGWLMLRHAALTLQIHGSRLNGGAFVEQSTNFSLSASNSSFSQGFQLVNVTSHIQLEEVEVWSGIRNPSFKMLSGRPEVHVAGSTFYGSAFEIIDSLDLILDVGGNTRITGGPGQRAIVVNGYKGHRSQVDLQDVEITRSDIGVGASDFQRCISGDQFFSQCQTDVRTQVWINGLDMNVRINNTNVSMASNIAITIYSVGNASDVKLDNIQIEQAILGADLSAKHLMAKNMYISDTQIGIRLDSDGEFELEGVKIKDVRTGLTARSAFRAKDLEISEAKVTAIDFEIKTDLPSQATGVSHFGLFSGGEVWSLWFFVNGRRPHRRKCPSSRITWRHKLSDLKWPCLL